MITSAQLREIGVPPSTITRRAQPGGMWTRVLPGVHLVGGGTPDRHQRETAALLYAGEGAVLTGLTALRRFGIRAGRLQETTDDRRHPESVFVLVPHERRRLATSFVQLERSRSMPDAPLVRVADGLALVPPARAVGDAARRMRDQSDVTAIVTEAIRIGLVTIDSLEAELHRGPVRGSGYLRVALDHGRARIWSAPEADLRTLIEPTELPVPRWNATILTANGGFLAIPDAWFDEVGLAIEVDSREHHADGLSWERTLARQRRYAEHGVLVLPITPRDLRDSPDAVLRAIRRAYAAAAARPRPLVRLATPPTVSTAMLPPRWGG
jgi:hypothetical protein